MRRSMHRTMLSAKDPQGLQNPKRMGTAWDCMDSDVGFCSIVLLASSQLIGSSLSELQLEYVGITQGA